jgi:hypothetical protein
MKKREMSFEGGGLKVTMPLDPMAERRYVDPTRKKLKNYIIQKHAWMTTSIPLQMVHLVGEV